MTELHKTDVCEKCDSQATNIIDGEKLCGPHAAGVVWYDG